MVEQAITYKMSKGIRRAKERYITLSIMMAIIMLGFLFLSPLTRDSSLGMKATVGLFSFIWIGLISIVTSTIVLRKLAELSILIFPDRFERANRRYREIFFWKDVQRVDILEYPKSEIASIKLTFAKRKTVTLYGLDDMQTAATKIEESIPIEASIHRKRMKLNWDQPSVTLFAGILMLAIILGLQEIGENAYRFFNVLFYISFGLYFLIGRPISRAQGKGWKLFETIIGVLLILSVLLTLWLILF